MKLTRVLAPVALALTALGMIGCGGEQSSSSNLNVYFAYADNILQVHSGPSTFPTPWEKSQRVNFVGQGPRYDSGAIRIDNAGDKATKVAKVTVDIGGKHYDLWGGDLNIPAHGSLILTQTGMDAQPSQAGTVPEPNFDTSENSNINQGSEPAIPVVHITAGTKTTDIKDSKRILTTGGVDKGTQPGSPNESSGWRSVGSVAAPEDESAGDSSWLGALGLAGLAAFLVSLLGFLPALIGALILLLVGWLLARLVARLVTLLLLRLGFGIAAERSGIAGLLARHQQLAPGDPARRQSQRGSLAWIVGVLAGVFVFLIFFNAALDVLHLSRLATLVTQFELWLPNLVLALVILVLGLVLAQIVGRLIQGTAAANGIGNPNLVARGAQGFVILMVAFVALQHLGIASGLMDAAFAGICIALALALGVAFGIGGRETAREMINRWYGNRRQPS